MTKLDISLEEKEKISQNIISDVLLNAKNPYSLFTGDKESLIVLHLIRQVGDGRITLPLLHIDTTVYFPEVYNFIEKMQRFWGFRIVRAKNEEAIRTIKIAEDKALCCHLLKTETLKESTFKYNIDYLFIAKKGGEKKRDPFFISTKKCIPINPIGHFSTKDTWHYIRKYNIPFCSLYEQGYRKLDCTPCTGVVSVGYKKDYRDNQTEEFVKDRLKSLGYL